MTRVAHLHPHLTPEELTSRARQAPDTTVARRFQLLRLIADGQTIQEAAARVGLGYSYARRYNDQGPEALRNRWREQRLPPPRPLLDAAQQEALRQALASRAPDGGLRNGPKVAQWIKERTGREHILLVLDGAGWHTSHEVVIPAGIEFVPLPAHSPELQPAERLWPLTNEAVANRSCASLDELDTVLGERCLTLADTPEMVRSYTRYHRWPDDA